MFRGGNLKNLFKTNRISSVIFRDNFTALTGLFPGKDDAEQQKFRHAFQSLVLPMLQTDGRFSESKNTVYRRLLEEHFDRADAEHHLLELNSITPLPEHEAVEILQHSRHENAEKSAEFLLALAVALDEPPGTVATAKRIAGALNISGRKFSHLHKKLRIENHRKKRLISSGHGILAVLVIITIFVLAAKFLQSVIFGLILASLLLPIEKFMERRLREKCGFPYHLVVFWDFLTAPLKKLSAALSRNIQPVAYRSKKSHAERKILRQSVILTAASAFFIAGIFCWGVAALTGNYMKNVQKNVQLWEQNNIPSEEDTSTTGKINFYLNKMQNDFRDTPVVGYMLNALDRIINDPEARNQAIASLLKHSGGVPNLTSDIFYTIITLLGNVMLTIFFALLFLHKMAEFCRNDNSDRRKSEYLVRSFFNGIWLPGANENVIKEACRIIEGIMFRLRVWLKGYLTLILVDASVYSICFFFIGVPFFLPLGVLAGCGIVLPYIGPVISCCTTLLVAISVGNASGGMLLAIIICYLIYNGIVEQFILYPSVIGGALGLNALETIIVVLLGAVVAGIPGMIFALPTASIAKYIIPQIYRGLIQKEPAEKA